jgi:hypothetical protein
LGSGYDPSTLTTEFTFSNFSLGPVYATRRIHVVTFGTDNTRTLSSLTVGGVSATVNATTTAGVLGAGIATATVPTGTSGDIVVTWSGTSAQCAIFVYASTGLTSNAALDTDTDVAGADPAEDTLTTVAGGFLIVGAINTGGSGTTLSFTGVTEDDELNETSPSIKNYASASKFPTTDTSTAVSASAAAAENVQIMISASFGP